MDYQALFDSSPYLQQTFGTFDNWAAGKEAQQQLDAQSQAASSAQAQGAGDEPLSTMDVLKGAAGSAVSSTADVLGGAADLAQQNLGAGAGVSNWLSGVSKSAQSWQSPAYQALTGFNPLDPKYYEHPLANAVKSGAEMLPFMATEAADTALTGGEDLVPGVGVKPITSMAMAAVSAHAVRDRVMALSDDQLAGVAGYQQAYQSLPSDMDEDARRAKAKEIFAGQAMNEGAAAGGALATALPAFVGGIGSKVARDMVADKIVPQVLTKLGIETASTASLGVGQKVGENAAMVDQGVPGVSVGDDLGKTAFTFGGMGLGLGALGLGKTIAHTGAEIEARQADLEQAKARDAQALNTMADNFAKAFDQHVGQGDLTSAIQDKTQEILAQAEAPEPIPTPDISPPPATDLSPLEAQVAGVEPDATQTRPDTGAAQDEIPPYSGPAGPQEAPDNRVDSGERGPAPEPAGGSPDHSGALAVAADVDARLGNGESPIDLVRALDSNPSPGHPGAEDGTAGAGASDGAGGPPAERGSEPSGGPDESPITEPTDVQQGASDAPRPTPPPVDPSNRPPESLPAERSQQSPAKAGVTEAQPVTEELPTPVVPEATPPPQPLAEKFRDHFAGGGRFDSITDARKFAEGDLGKVKPGTPEAKQVDEAVEQGVVMAARKLVDDHRAAGKTDTDTYKALVDLYDRQPNLGVRTSTSVAQQAYSTPAPIAYLASRLADIDRSTSVYEPTAGNGMLLVDANKEKAVVNELNPERAAALKAQGYNVTENDATEYSPPAVDRVIANPPFGRIPGESWDVGGINTREVDHAIALQALDSMKDDGKAVLILGGKQGEGEGRASKYQAKTYRDFYRALLKNYQVTDHFSIDGNLYKKQGAGYPIDVITIDGKGNTEGRKFPAAELPRVYKSFDALEELLNGQHQSASIPEVQEGVDSIRGDDGTSGATPGGDERNSELGHPDVAPGGETGGPGEGGRGPGVGGKDDNPDAGRGRPDRPGSRPDGPGEGERPGMDRPALENTVDEFRKGLANGADIETHDNAEAASAATGKDIPPDAKAFYDDGKVHVVADQISDAKDLGNAVLHEQLRHHGLRLALGDRYDQEMRAAWSNPEVRRMARDLYTNGGYDDLKGAFSPGATDADRARAAEEAISHLGDSGWKSSTMDRIIVRVRQWVRKVAPGLDYSDAEVRDLISKSAQQAAYGQRRSFLGQAQAELAPMFKRRAKPITEEESANVSPEDVNRMIWQGLDPAKFDSNRITDGIEHEIQRMAGNTQKRTGVNIRDTFDNAKSRLLDKASQLYADMGDKPEEIKAYLDGAKKELENASPADSARLKRNIAVAERTLAMTPEEKAFVDDKIRPIYDQIKQTMKDYGLLNPDFEGYENYTRRIWDLDDNSKKIGFGGTGLRLNTDATKKRSLDSILEGWRQGHELKAQGLTQSLGSLLNEVNRIKATKDLQIKLSALTGADGERVFSIKGGNGKVQVKSPQLYGWRFAGSVDAKAGEVHEEDVQPWAPKYSKKGVEPGEHAGVQFTRIVPAELCVDNQGRSIYATPPRFDHEGNASSTMLERVPLYVDKAIGDPLNKVLDRSSVIRDTPILNTLMKANNFIKSTILTTSFFHHLSMSRAYLLGVKGGPMNPLEAARQGMDLISKDNAVLRDYGVKNGLTLGINQDYDPNKGYGIVVKTLEKSGLDGLASLARGAADVRAKAENYLFNQMAPGLKALSWHLEFTRQVDKARAAGKTVDDDFLNNLGERVARVMNENFGGLHQGRMGRSQTVQDLSRMLFLAPDWTESNLRSAIGAISPKILDGLDKSLGGVGSPEGIATDYRNFWGRALTRGVGATIIANMMVNGWNQDDRKKYLDFLAGQCSSFDNFRRLKWAGIYADPIFRIAGLDTKGQDRTVDLFGAFKDPARMALAPDLFFKNKMAPIPKIGADLATGTDYAGRPFTSASDLIHGKGTVAQNHYGEAQPFFSRMPSTALSELAGAAPIQIQNVVHAVLGDTDVGSAIAQSAGLGVSPSPYANADVNNFNSNLKTARGAYNDYKGLRGTDKAQGFLSDNPEARGYKILQHVESTLSRLREQQNEVAADTTLSTADKNAKLDAIRAKMSTIAAQANANYKKVVNQ